MVAGKSITAEDVCSKVGGQLRGNRNAPIDSICTLGTPKARHLAFVKDVALLKGTDPTAGGVVLLAPATADGSFAGTYICVDNPRLAFALAVRHFFAQAFEPGIAASARVHPSAVIGSGVAIGENCVIKAGVTIGDNTEIRNNVVIHDRVTIGADCIIKSNAVIGEEGFGIDTDATGRHVRLPHLGSVIIGNNVQIGALSFVAAGTIDPTIIEDNVMIDDQVHISHNCRIGANSFVTAGTVLSGSVDVGRNGWLGPNCSVIQKVSIAPDTLVGIGSVVIKTLKVPGTYTGMPARRYWTD